MARPRNLRRPDRNPVGSSGTLVQVPSRSEEKEPRSGLVFFLKALADNVASLRAALEVDVSSVQREIIHHD